MNSIFITGTDTNVGKTFVLCGMLKALRGTGINAVGFKPVECGEGRRDSTAIAEICELPVESVNPVWYQTPVAPAAAAALEGERWESARVLSQYEELRKHADVVLVEGAGGWHVPITGDLLVSDFASQLGLDVLVVAANRLGVLNHASLTVESISQQLHCCGIVLNNVVKTDDSEDVSQSSNAAVLKTMNNVPVWGWENEGICPENLISLLVGD